MTQYIYAVYDGWQTPPEIQEVEVLKVTPKQIVTGRSGLGFKCHTHHDPATVSWTPKEAWTKYITSLERDIERTQENLAEMETRLAQSREALDRL